MCLGIRVSAYQLMNTLMNTGGDRDAGGFPQTCGSPSMLRGILITVLTFGMIAYC